MIPSPDLLPDEPMTAPQRPTRRAPQMRKTMPSRAAPFQRCADASRPVSGQAAILPTLPGQTGPGQSTPRETAHTPRQSASTGVRPVPRLRNISATRCPQNLRAAFPRRSSARLRADLGAHSRRPSPPGPLPACRRCPRSPGIAPTNRRQRGKAPSDAPATSRICVFPATPPPARFRPLTFSRQPRFRRLRADRRASPNALSEATFIRVRSAGLQFSARLRSSRAQPPPCFRSPRGFRLLPRAPLSLWFPRPIPRVFLAPFPAPSPHFCRTLSRLFAPHL